MFYSQYYKEFDYMDPNNPENIKVRIDEIGTYPYGSISITYYQTVPNTEIKYIRCPWCGYYNNVHFKSFEFESEGAFNRMRLHCKCVPCVPGLETEFQVIRTITKEDTMNVLRFILGQDNDEKVDETGSD